MNVGGIHVTVVGNHSLGINEDNRLVYFPDNSRDRAEVKDLGPATSANVESLIYALTRLKIHTID